MVLHLSTCHSLLQISLIRCWCSWNPVSIHHLGCIGCIYQTAATSGNWNISSRLRKPRLGGCLQQYGDPWNKIRLAGASGVSCFLSFTLYTSLYFGFFRVMDVFAFPRDFRISDILLQAVCLFVRVRLPEINGNVFLRHLWCCGGALLCVRTLHGFFPRGREFPLPKK